MDLGTLKIGVVGGGVVGRATARCWLEHVAEVRVYDIDMRKRTHDFDQALDSDLVFFCVPENNLSEVFSDWALRGRENRNFVLKSTVPIGTTRRLAKNYELTNLVHSPEFLTARCAVADAQMPARNIIGLPNTPFMESVGCGVMLANIYTARFPGVPVVWMTSDESEAVKLVQNGFFATKVSYFNEVYQLCQNLKLNWQRVRSAVLADGRISSSHTRVPGPDGKLGFGGTCLPKDLDMLIEHLKKSDDDIVTRAVKERNEYDRPAV